MSTLTTTRLDTLPRVNLLPPEIAEQRRFRQVQAGLGAAAVASLGVAGLLFALASSQASQAQDDLDQSKVQGSRLQTQTADYAEVPAVQAQVDAARSQLELAMGKEVRWSYYLNDLSLKVPNRVWLTDLTVTSTADAAVVAPAVTSAAPAYAVPGIGSVTFSGQAYSHNDVAAWLNSLAKQRGYVQPYFTDSTVTPIGTNDKAVKFTSQVTVTEDALSKRYVQKAGN